MHVFYGLMHNIVVFLTTAYVPRNASELEWLNNTEENSTIPRTSKIIKGSQVLPEEYPPIAGLVLRKRAAIVSCTGTVLNRHYVLTAGHCVNGALSITIFTGCTNLKTCRERKQGVGILHPRYGMIGNAISNDIGLVRTCNELSATAYAILSTVTTHYQGCVVMGYGFTSENLQQPNSKLYKLEIRKVSPCTFHLPPDSPVTTNMICSVVEHNKRYNYGDSGGPLLCNNTQIGITSQLLNFTKREGHSIAIMTWVPVSIYVDWVHSVISSSNRPSFKVLLAMLLLFVTQLPI